MPLQNKQQDDVNEVSILSQAITGRSPTQRLNSTIKDGGLASNIGIQLADIKTRIEEEPAIDIASSSMPQRVAKDAVMKVPFEIVPIEFETALKLKNFLESLFQLKPNLLTSYALDKFRIVVEINQEMNSERILKAFTALERTIS